LQTHSFPTRRSSDLGPKGIPWTHRAGDSLPRSNSLVRGSMSSGSALFCRLPPTGFATSSPRQPRAGHDAFVPLRSQGARAPVRRQLVCHGPLRGPSCGMSALGCVPKMFPAWDEIAPLTSLHIWIEVVRDEIACLLGACGRLHVKARWRTRQAIAQGGGILKCLAVCPQLIRNLWGDNSDPHGMNARFCQRHPWGGRQERPWLYGWVQWAAPL